MHLKRKGQVRNPSGGILIKQISLRDIKDDLKLSLARQPTIHERLIGDLTSVEAYGD